LPSHKNTDIKKYTIYKFISKTKIIHL